ncbi:MAG: fasciclin domain-containing protein [Bacteroidales bacterium]
MIECLQKTAGKYSSMSTTGWILQIMSMTGFFLFNSCETELGEIYKDPTKEQVYSYLKIEENREEFSTLAEAMDKSGLAGMLNSYGTYTLFAPCNDGFETYFSNRGITGLEKMDSAAVRELLVYHILNKERLTSDLSPGFSPDTTARGDYLVFDMSKGDGAIWVNSKSRMYKVDRRVTNGVVHHIDQVLIPPTFTIWHHIDGSPLYKIFSEALKKTGKDSDLNLVKLRYGKLNKTFTAFAESDEVFQSAGINSLAELENELDSRGSDLQEFIEYHIIEGKRLKGAIFSFMIQNEGMVTQSGKSINANIEFGLVFNQWWDQDGTQHATRLIEEQSDIFAQNGVFHAIDQVLFIPEDLELEPIIRQCEYGIFYNELTGKFEVDQDSLALWTPGTEVYLEANDTLLRYDAIQKSNYISFKLENIIPGEYNIILGYESNLAFAQVQLYIDGTPVGESVDLTEAGPGNEAEIGLKGFVRPGDHVFKFIHLTNGDGLYDYIKLDPVTE